MAMVLARQGLRSWGPGHREGSGLIDGETTGETKGETMA